MGIIERKEREKQKRKAGIIHAAEKVFFSKGFDKTTMDDIAEAAELSKGTLYLYFKSKEDLHVTVAMKAIELLNSKTESIRKIKGNAIQKLVKLGWAFIGFSKDFPDQMNSILFLEGLDMQRISMSISDLRNVIYRDSPVKLVMEFVEQGIGENTVRKDIPPEIIANTLWMQMLSVIQLVTVKKVLIEMVEPTPEKLYESHIELVLNGIKP